MKKSIKRVLSLISVVAMLSTTALVANANTAAPTLGDVATMEYNATSTNLVTADVVTITSATSKLEAVAYSIIANTLGTTADLASILAAVDTTPKEELTAKMDTLKTALVDNAEVKAAVAAVKTETEAAIADIKAKNPNAKIVISDVYNPLNVIVGGANVAAIKTLVDDYVVETNTTIAAVAVDAGAQLVEVSKIAPTKTVSAADIAAGTVQATTVVKEAEAAVIEQAKETVDLVPAPEGVEVVNYGDITNDGTVAVVDAVAMIKFILEDETLETFAEKGFSAKAADVKKDDKSTIDLNDLTQLKLYLLEVEGIELGK